MKLHFELSDARYIYRVVSAQGRGHAQDKIYIEEEFIVPEGMPQTVPPLRTLFATTSLRNLGSKSEGTHLLHAACHLVVRACESKRGRAEMLRKLSRSA